MALAGLGWTPPVFWASTASEIRLAMEGRRRMSGEPEPMLSDRLAELVKANPPTVSIRNRSA